MSTATEPEPQLGTPAAPQAPGGDRRRWRPGRGLLVIVGGVVVAVVAAAALVSVGGSRPSRGRGFDNGVPTSLATVRRGALSSQVEQSGTLGYATGPDGSPYQAINEASGNISALPNLGDVIAEGHTLYRVANNPVVLLDGSTPAYRTLSEGDSGPDVRELNADLVALGYATEADVEADPHYFGSATAVGVERLQAKLGEEQTGALDLGQAIFLHAPLRVTKVTATLGGPAHPGEPVLEATSTRRQVVVQLDATEQSSVKVGDRAEVTLPDHTVTKGRVSSIGNAASSGGSSGQGSSSATIPVYVRLDHPRAAGSLDQAPVEVTIRTAGVSDALVVPTSALLALAGGGYALELAVTGGSRRLVPVTPGLFDDADGLVQVTGAVSAGDRIVVPST